MAPYRRRRTGLHDSHVLAYILWNKKKRLVRPGLRRKTTRLCSKVGGNFATQNPGAIAYWEPLGDYIRQNSTPKDKIYVWGWYPGIYVQAQRFSPSPRAFESEMHIKSPHDLAESIRKLVEALQKEKPKFIVDSRKRHLPIDRFPFELWPIIPKGFMGIKEPAFLPDNKNVIFLYDKLWSDKLREQFGEDEALRYEAMKPFREFVMTNYHVVKIFGETFCLNLTNLQKIRSKSKVARLNLLMLNYEFPPIGGGAGYAHLAILHQFALNPDLKIDVLTSAPKRGFYKEQLSENITIYKVGVNKKNLHYWRKIEVIEWLIKARHYYRRLLEGNNYNLVHAFFGFPTGWLCYRSAEELPYIISLRGSDVPGEHARLKFDYKIFAPVFRRIWENADAVVACSRGLKNRALKFLPSVLIDVIPNGVDLNLYAPVENKPRDARLKLLTVGRLSATKRVELLIDAVRVLRKSNYNVHLSIVGGGSLQNYFRHLVAERKLNDCIEITGRIEKKKMPEIYRQSDIFVSATMQEGMSNAMLEAMASGLPIVTTACEGIEELIADNGIVVGQPVPKPLPTPSN